MAYLRGRNPRAFTLVELLLSMTVLAILLVLVTNVVSVIEKGWSRTNSRTSQFREARSALDTLSRNLSQATLNTYWANAYDVLGADTLNQQISKAKSFIRNSELQFVSGQISHLLTGANDDYVSHGVFFQAPFGITSMATVQQGQLANTENMVNLLCGRGYFVKWGDDSAFRPSFLTGNRFVPVRSRFRLMEYCPTAEMNKIYYDPTNPVAYSAGNPTLANLSGRRPISDRSKLWFQDVAANGSQSGEATQGQTTQDRAFTRPMADNVIALVISPQTDNLSNPAISPTLIAPHYDYDSTVLNNATPGVVTGPQVTQHLLPPLLRITLVALDSASAERLARASESGVRSALVTKLSSCFQTPGDYTSVNSGYKTDLNSLEEFLVANKLNYRVFTTTIIMKAAQWAASSST